MDIIKCDYCGKICKNKMSKSKHEQYCMQNPNHKSHDHFRKNAEKTNNILKLRKRTSQKEYIMICKNCGEKYSVMLTETKYKNGKYKKYCSRSCANRRILTQEIKNKISNSLTDYNKTLRIDKLPKNTEGIKKYKNYIRFPKERVCKVCHNVYYISRDFPNSTKIVCSKECSEYLSKHRCEFLSNESLNRISEGGRKSAQAQQEKHRSKNEIYFYELCKEHFKNVKHNECIFNGWDADVIIEDIKTAILWNGIWHYEKITKKHSVEQVQNRDKIKISEIKKCGYKPYIIKDIGKYNQKFVEEQFKLFLNTAAWSSGSSSVSIRNNSPEMN